jgi:putative ABC transport system permease protein
MSLLARDLRYTARTLRRTPGFAISASLILALGIGAATTTFSVANAVLFRSLPFPNPQTLVSVFEWTTRGNREGVAPATFLDWRAQNRCFTALATSRGLDINLTGAGEPEQLGGATVSEGMFELLGAVPTLGRGFARADYRVGAPRAVVLSHKFWQRRFAADPNVLGRIILLGGEPHTIIGVMPASFWFFWGRMDVWTPLRFTSKDLAGRGGRASLMTIGRLKSGVSLAQAQAEMEALSARLLHQHRDMQGWGVKVRPLHEQEELVRRARPALRLLLGAVAVVMLIVCANLANLLLARGSGRAKEIAIRAALGASRGALVAQLLVEALVLAAIGGALGVLFANWGIRLAASLIPEDLRMSLPAGPEQIGINSEIVLFALAISLFTGLLFGLAPALQLSQPKLSLTMQRPRHILAAAEIALSLVLLIAATFLLQSYMRAYRLDLGYRPRGVQAMLLLGVKHASADEIVSKVEAIPGVQAAGPAGLWSGRSISAGWTLKAPPRIRRARCKPMCAAATSRRWASRCSAGDTSRARKTIASAT